MIVRDELITDEAAAPLLGIDRRDIRWLAGNQQIGCEWASTSEEFTGHNTYYFSRSEIVRRDVWLKHWLRENPSPYKAAETAPR